MSYQLIFLRYFLKRAQMDFSVKIVLLNVRTRVRVATMLMVCVTEDAIQAGWENTVIGVSFLTDKRFVVDKNVTSV